jgi:hypothetical protein
MHFFPLPFSFSGPLAFLFITELMLFDFIADLKKTTAVPAPAHLFFHMHLLILGVTLTDGWRVKGFLGGNAGLKNVMEKLELLKRRVY